MNSLREQEVQIVGDSPQCERQRRPESEASSALSSRLRFMAGALPPNGVKVAQLLEMLGEAGLLTTCMFLTLPFLVPVSIPGVSTAFGLLIVLLSIGVIANRTPWLPKWLLNRTVPSERMAGLLQRGAGLCARLEAMIRPRFLFLTGDRKARINGVALLFGGILLMAPSGAIPFANTLPALAILLLAAAILQRDGIALICGYVLLAATIVYFCFVFVAIVATTRGIMRMI